MTTHKTLLAKLMSERNLSQEDVEKRFRQAAEDLEHRAITVSPRQLSRWISGTGGIPRPVARRVLEHLFECPVDDLLAPPSPSIIDRVGEAPRRHFVEDVDPVSSASFHATHLVKASASRARALGLVVGSMSMSPELTDQLHADLRHLGSVYQQVPLNSILGDVVSAQDSVYRLLESRRSPRQSRELYFLAGVAGGMLAKASHDLAEPHAALTHARTAFLCAEQADHPGLMAWTRSLQALIAYWAGRPGESANYAAHARELATPRAGTAFIWAQLSQARALAANGDGNSARTLILEAENQREFVVPDELDEIGGLFTFGSIRQLYYAGEALSWISEDAADAATYSERAVEGYRDRGSEWAFGDEAGAHANLAIARLLLGEPEGAREALLPLLQLPQSQRMNGIILSAQRVSRHLTRSPKGRNHADLQDEIESFCRVPAAALTR